MVRPVRIFTPQRAWTAYLREMVSARRVLYFLIGRELISRYRQTVFGLAWAVLQPLGMMVAITVVFGHSATASSMSVPYAVFVVTGLLPWQLFTRTLEMSAVSLVQHRAMITKLYLPRVYVPLSHAVAGVVDTVCGVVVLCAVMAYYGVPLQPALLALPLLIAYALYTALGLGLMLAVLHARYRDVQYALSFFLKLGFFMTPVAYPLSSVAPAWQWVCMFNPVTGALEAMRWAVAGGAFPWMVVGLSVAVSTLLLACGMRVFMRMEAQMVDAI